MAYNRGSAAPGSVGQQRPILPGYVRMRKPIDFGNAATNCFDFEEAVSFLCSPVVADEKNRKGLVASPVYLVDPCQRGVNPLKTQTIFPANVVDSNLPDGAALAGVFTGSYASLTSGASFKTNFMHEGLTQTSAANTVLAFSVSLRNLNQGIDIIMQASGGTATLVVEVSIDNSTWLQVDSIAAALTTVKHYNNTTVGGGTFAVSPPLWPFMRVTAGAAGAGFTTTLTIAVK